MIIPGGHGGGVTQATRFLLSPGRWPDEKEHVVRCCGNPSQVITLQAGEGALVLTRCAACETQQWQRDGQPVAREEAFVLLGQAYREVPLRARAARDRAATQSAARQAARAAARQPRTITLPDAGRDTSDLAALLQGWQVLGAAS